MESKMTIAVLVLLVCVIGLSIIGPIMVQERTGKVLNQQTVSGCLLGTRGSLLDCFSLKGE